MLQVEDPPLERRQLVLDDGLAAPQDPARIDGLVGQRTGRLDLERTPSSSASSRGAVAGSVD